MTACEVHQSVTACEVHQSVIAVDVHQSVAALEYATQKCDCFLYTKYDSFRYTIACVRLIVIHTKRVCLKLGNNSMLLLMTAWCTYC